MARAGAALPPPIKVQCGAPPNSDKIPSNDLTGGASSAPIPQPRESRILILSCLNADSERSLKVLEAANSASSSAVVIPLEHSNFFSVVCNEAPYLPK